MDHYCLDLIRVIDEMASKPITSTSRVNPRSPRRVTRQNSDTKSSSDAQSLASKKKEQDHTLDEKTSDSSKVKSRGVAAIRKTKQSSDKNAVSTPTSKSKPPAKTKDVDHKGVVSGPKGKPKPGLALEISTPTRQKGLDQKVVSSPKGKSKHGLTLNLPSPTKPDGKSLRSPPGKTSRGIKSTDEKPTEKSMPTRKVRAPSAKSASPKYISPKTPMSKDNVVPPSSSRLTSPGENMTRRTSGNTRDNTDPVDSVMTGATNNMTHDISSPLSEDNTSQNLAPTEQFSPTEKKVVVTPVRKASTKADIFKAIRNCENDEVFCTSGINDENEDFFKLREFPLVTVLPGTVTYTSSSDDHDGDPPWLLSEGVHDWPAWDEALEGDDDENEEVTYRLDKLTCLQISTCLSIH